jgi:hypothetical protein
MVEQKIEKIVIDKLNDALEGVQVQFIGMWQTDDGEKACENGASAVVAVKAYPRAYDTPTIPDASIAVDISLAVRSDVDFGGLTYLDLTTKIQEVLQTWQLTFDDSHTEFSIEGEFDETGFNLIGGDCGIDRENKVWQFNQSFTVYGIIL